MTIADDRIDELDFNLLEEPDFDTWDINDDVIPYGRDDLSAPAVDVAATVQQILNSVLEILETPQKILDSILDVLEVPRLTMDDLQEALEKVRSESMIEAYRQGYSDYHGRNWYCFCSPSRGQFFQRYMEGCAAQVEPVTCHLWVAGDE